MKDAARAVADRAASALPDYEVHAEPVPMPTSPTVGDLVFVTYRPPGQTAGWTHHPESGWWSRYWMSGDTPLHQPYVIVTGNLTGNDDEAPTTQPEG